MTTAELDRIAQLETRVKAQWVTLFEAQLELIHDLICDLDVAKERIRVLESRERPLPQPVFYNREDEDD